MLPTELLVIHRWKDQIRPRYSKLDGRSQAAAEAIIGVYSRSVSLKRGAIREKVSELEDAYGDYRFIRGLAALIERSCVFRSNASADPVQVRHALFALAASKGYPTEPMQRRSIVEAVASEFKLTPEQVEASMYADLEDEQVLVEVPKMAPAELLKQYNLSLTQTLLFQSTETEFMAGGNWQHIFRAIKYRGLMYTARRSGGHMVVRVDGPVSLLKLTRRYGTALAKVLPEIIRGKPWRIDAKILRANRLLNFTLESAKHGWLFPEQAAKEAFDSTVEEEFANQFKALKTCWALHREMEPVEAGSSVIIPDFTFKFGGATVHMEVAGFWTKEYLRRKLEKLAEVRGTPFIVAVDEELACDKLTRLTSENPNIHLIYYKGKIAVKDVLGILQPLAEAEVERQTAALKITLDREVVPLAEVVKKYGASPEAVKRAAESVESHELIGDAFISKRLLSKVKQMLENIVAEEEPLPKVLEALKPYGLPDPTAIITRCGFKIRWHGLLPENAIVSKS